MPKERANKLLSTIKDEFKPSPNGIIQVNNPSYSQQRVYHPLGLAPTLAAGNLGGGKEPCKILLETDGGYEVRKITPREAARLQGFDDSYKQVVSDTQFYKQMGNAVTVNVARVIAEKIKGDLGMEKVLRVNDLFCGAGGMGLGFKQAGFRLAGAWDFDKWAVESYGNNVSPKVKQADITLMEWNELPYADVWTFGAPCQAFSVAGRQLGMKFKCTSCDHTEDMDGEDIVDRNTKCSKCGNESKPIDPRGVLFFEVMRLLKNTDQEQVERLPKIILLENVKGIKKFLPAVEEQYKKRGYKMYYTLYNSKFWGVPQNRERYFVVGVRDDMDKPFIFPEQQTDFVPKLSSILETEVDEKYYIDDEKAKTVIEQAMKRVELNGVHSCITPDRVDKRQNGRRAKEDEAEIFTLTAQDRHGVIEPSTDSTDKLGGIWGNRQAGSCWNKNGVSPTLKTPSGGYSEPLVLDEQPKIDVIGKLDMKGQDNIRRVYDQEGISPTLTTSEGGHRQPKVLEGFRVRKLTPREYARLQGFPESFQFHVSNSQLYKQFGNAVTVNVAKAIAERIKTYLETV